MAQTPRAMTVEGASSKCVDMRNQHGVVPNQSWGTLPTHLQAVWTKLNCDAAVGAPPIGAPSPTEKRPHRAPAAVAFAGTGVHGLNASWSHRPSKPWCRDETEQRISRANLILGGEPLRVGVVGGSISWGAELENLLVDRWPSRLADYLPRQVARNIKVENRAMPATSVALPSFCLESMVMPEASRLDFLFVEYNFNDAFGMEQDVALGGASLGPESSMERLIRTVLSSSERPPWIGIVAVCRAWQRCESIFSEVANHYSASGVFEISLHRDGHPSFTRSPSYRPGGWPFFNASHHPNRVGHGEIARLAAEQMKLRLSVSPMAGRGQSRACARLPPPRWITSSWEIPGVPWDCRACWYFDCPRLPAIPLPPGELPEASRFELVRPVSDKGDEGPREAGLGKLGWLATREGSTVGFELDGGADGATVILAALCSYDNVGAAEVYLTGRRTTRLGAHAAAAPSAGGSVKSDGLGSPGVKPRLKPWLSLDFLWSSRSSQQCLARLGSIPPGAHRLWLRVSSNRTGSLPTRPGNQVKIFGIYLQPLRQPPAPPVPAADHPTPRQQSGLPDSEWLRTWLPRVQSVRHMGWLGRRPNATL